MQSIFFLVLLHVPIFFAVLLKKTKKMVISFIFGLSIGGIIIYYLNFWVFRLTHEFALTMVFRYYLYSILFTWFFLTVTPEDLAQALVQLGIPYRWAWQLSATYQFVYHLQREVKQIYEAQIARGIPLDGNLFQKLKYIPSIIVPLTIKTQQSQELLFQALLLRAWNPYSPKSFLYPLTFSKVDYVVWVVLPTILLMLQLIS